MNLYCTKEDRLRCFVMRTFKSEQFIHAKLTELTPFTHASFEYAHVQTGSYFQFWTSWDKRRKEIKDELKYFQLTWTTLRFLLWSKPTWLVFLDRQAPNTEGRVEQPWKCASPERSLPSPQSKRWSQSRNTHGWPCLSCCCRRKDDEKMCPACILPSVQRK